MGRDFRLGLLFFGAILILGFATLTIKNLPMPWAPKAQELTIRFDRVTGLKQGDPVRVDGVEVGRVEDFSLLPQGVEVTVRIDKPIRLFEDYDIAVDAASLLGGSMIAIRRGDPAKPEIDLTQPLRGRTQGNPMNQLSDLLGENRQSVNEILSGLREIVTEIREGRGTVGKLVKDDSLFTEARDAVKNIKNVAEKVDTGQGTVGKLVNDPAVFDEAKEALKNAREVAEKINRGDGTIGKLVNDDAVFENIKQVSEDLKSVTAQVKSGEGALGKVIYDKEMGDDVKSAVKDLKEMAGSLNKMSKKISEGEGTVGKLVNDDSLYKKADSAITGLDDVVGKISRMKVYAGGQYLSFIDRDASMSRLYLRIEPSEDRYFQVGGVWYGLSRNSDIDFDDKVNHGRDGGEFKPEILLGWRMPEYLWFDRNLFFRIGMLEGRPGGGLDYEWPGFPILGKSLRFSFEMRDAFSDLKDEDIDENIRGPMARAYFSAKLAKDVSVLNRIRVFAGVNSVFDDPEFMGGISFEYPDDDIRALVGLVGLSR